MTGPPSGLVTAVSSNLFDDATSLPSARPKPAKPRQHGTTPDPRDSQPESHVAQSHPPSAGRLASRFLQALLTPAAHQAVPCLITVADGRGRSLFVEQTGHLLGAMSRRDHGAAAQPSYTDEYRQRSPANHPAGAYSSPYPRFAPSTYVKPNHIPLPTSILPGNGPPFQYFSEGAKMSGSRSGTPAGSVFSVDSLQSTREISPPPLKRAQSRPELQKLTSNPAPVTQQASSPLSIAQLVSSPSRTSHGGNNPVQWNKPDLAKRLQSMLEDVRQDHSRLVTQAIESVSAKEWRIHHSTDIFAGLGLGPISERKGETMRIKFKVCRLRLHEPSGPLLTVFAPATLENTKGSARRTPHRCGHQNNERTSPAIPVPSRRDQEECPHSQHNVDICATSARP